MAKRNKGFKPKTTLKPHEILYTKKKEIKETQQEKDFNFFRDLMRQSLGGRKSYS